MTHGRAEAMFSAREMRYIQSLPAVDHVTPYRICYKEEFKRECIRRYYKGESPTVIFRNAGLDSSLIGYKRIERSIARWKNLYPDEIGADDEPRRRPAIDIPESQRWSGPMASRAYDAGKDNEDGHGAGTGREDVRGYRLVILQQARRIDQLEHELESYRQRERREDGEDMHGGEARE
ncbi:hypothetical protein [Bifidobacterium pullorum]|uniref:hypothetical protein n=1 Tax=Bifidobacterium pullorum TaxID=78448 RepID=UPI001269EC07|nr:hypothetical protein [Bifidobacterium pullorum]